MLTRFKIRLAARTENPFFRLLLLDWRFTSIIFVVIGVVLFSFSLPLKIWRRTPNGFVPEVKVSALDLIQSRVLARSARKAERNDNWELSSQSWSAAFANDPCNADIAAGYIRALQHSPLRARQEMALKVALWRARILPGSDSSELIVAAADPLDEWDIIIQTCEKFGPEIPAGLRMPVIRAFFRSGKYSEAKKILDSAWKDRAAPLLARLYSEAVECILRRSDKANDCETLREALDKGEGGVEAMQIYLLVSAEKSDVREYEETLGSLKQRTDRTISFDVLHARLLMNAGRAGDARKVAAEFRAPKSAREAYEIADTLLALGNRAEATAFLRGYHLEFAEAVRVLNLYGRLIAENGNKKELRTFRAELIERPSSAGNDVLISAISWALEPTAANLRAVTVALSRAGTDSAATDSWYLAGDIFKSFKRPDLACEVLARIEALHRDDAEFYSKLFAMAEANRDAALMRRVAESAYRLKPADLKTAANYAAMLIMCGENPDLALALSAGCMKANPRSTAARVNYAAALIDAGAFGLADSILGSIDEAALGPSARNQLRFIKMKRAVKLRDKTEVVRLNSLLNKATLYSVQVEWLAANSI